MKDRLAIVILNWNGIQLLKDFLPLVVERSAHESVTVYIADNGSTDDSVAWVSQTFPSVNIIQNKENLGYAAGYNLALKQIKAQYYCLLNSDVEVNENWIHPILEHLDANPTCGACQPKILSYYQKNHFEYAGAAGGYIDKWGYPFCRGRIFDTLEKDSGQYDENKPIFWASGACFFVRSDAYWSAGGLDEHFFAHMEEIDLCWRLKRLGYHIMSVYNSKIYHVGGGTLQYSNPRKTFLNFRNNKAMLAKNLPLIHLIKVLFIRNILDNITILRELIKGNFNQAWAIIKAEIFFLLTFLKWRKAYRKFECAIPNNKVGPKNMEGFHSQSIVWQYFLKGKNQFSSLSDN